MLKSGSKKRPRQQLAYRFRHLGLNAAALTQQKSLQRRLLHVWMLMDDEEEQNGVGGDDDLLVLEAHLLNQLSRLSYLHSDVIYPPIDRLPRNIAFIQAHYEADCEILFRFRADYLRRLFVCLEFPVDCTLSNGSHLGGEEVFLFSLCRLTYPDRLHTMTSDMWGGEVTQWSRAFKYFNLFIYNNHRHRMNNNFAFWTNRFQDMAVAIQNKLIELGVQYGHDEQQLICCFIDDTVRQICRPGSGPNSRRFEGMNDMQRAFYSGWCAQHSLVWQTVDSPYGMVMDAWGPGAGRHQDRERLRASAINEKLRDAQVGQQTQYKMFGDNIFFTKSHLLVKHPGEGYVLTDRQQQENEARPKVRVSIEWDYCTTSRLFKFVNYKDNCKICCGGSNAALTYFSAMFLKNCHVCLYSCETAHYFNLVPPTLEEYLYN